METRKVQVTGGSTYTVSLPKGWAKANDIEAGSTVELYPEQDTVLLTPLSQEEHTEGALDVSSLTGEELKRAVMTMYVSGFDIIVLEAGHVSGEQRRGIREATQSLVGLEVLEESDERVVVRDLLDSSELSIHNAVTRMELIAESMLADAVAALTADDNALAESVIDRDDDVDRLYMMVSRIFRATLRNPKAAEELGLPREGCFDYHSSARQLERIADHATKMAHLSSNLGGLPEAVVAALEELHEDTEAVIDTATDALFAEEGDEATRLGNEARDSILAIDEHARSIDELLRTLEPHEAQQLGLIVDSLSRSADYGGNIAETALQKAAPTP